MHIKIIDFKVKGDERGSLVALEAGKDIPFEIKRTYYIFGTSKGVRRGLHAHKQLKQLALCVKGSCRFLLDDGFKRCEVLLDRPDRGLYIDSLIWREMFDFSDDCVLLVFADAHYDEIDYIRDYATFKEAACGYVHP